MGHSAKLADDDSVSLLVLQEGVTTYIAVLVSDSALAHVEAVDEGWTIEPVVVRIIAPLELTRPISV